MELPEELAVLAIWAFGPLLAMFTGSVVWIFKEREVSKAEQRWEGAVNGLRHVLEKQVHEVERVSGERDAECDSRVQHLEQEVLGEDRNNGLRGDVRMMGVTLQRLELAFAVLAAKIGVKLPTEVSG